MKRLLATLRLAVLVILWLGAGAIVLKLAFESARFIDLSSAGRNTLDDTSRQVVASMDAAVEILVFVPERADLRRGISEFFARYQRAQPKLSLSFVDPAAQPQVAERHGANLGEIVFIGPHGQERITELSDTEVINALARLLRAGERFVVFLNGNGERRISRDANHDVSVFAAALEQRGLRLREINPGATTAIPDNTAVLVLASPAVAYAPGDVDLITGYVERGGNLLWLRDPNQKADLSALSSRLGIASLPGSIVDPVGLTRFRNPAFAVAAEHPAHDSLNGFQQSVIFPYAQALLPQAAAQWQAHILLRTSNDAWTETGPFEGNVGYDADDEVQGSLALAMAYTRQHDETHQQRMVVVGDGDFVSNTYVENQGNLELGRRVVEWLAADDHLIELSYPARADAELDLAMWQRMLIFFVFGLLIPLGLAANAALYWWRQHHA